MMLIYFIMDYNSKHPHVLVTWSNLQTNRKGKLEKALEMNVPVMSSTIPISWVIISAILMVIPTTESEIGQRMLQIVRIIFLLLVDLHVPLTIALTLWSKKRRKKRKITNLPTGLQFHDETFVNEYTNENAIEIRPAETLENPINMAEEVPKQNTFELKNVNEIKNCSMKNKMKT